MGLLIWLWVVGYGFLLLGRNWSDFFQNRVNAFSAMDIVWIASTWMVLTLFTNWPTRWFANEIGARQSQNREPSRT